MEYNYYDDLEFTLEEELILTEGVKDLLKELKKWFDEKKLMIKNKIKESKDSKAKKAFNDVLDVCGEGLNAIQQRDVEKAKVCKEKAIKGLKVAATIVGGALAAGKAYGSLNNKGDRKGYSSEYEKRKSEIEEVENERSEVERQRIELNRKIVNMKEDCMYLAEDLKSTLKSIKEWFKGKIDYIKAKFLELKNKITKKANNLPSDKKQEVNSLMNENKKICNDILSDCKQGINEVNKSNIEEANNLKNKVSDNIKKFAKTASALAVLVASVGAVGYATGIKRGKDRATKEIDRNIKGAKDQIESNKLALNYWKDYDFDK